MLFTGQEVCLGNNCTQDQGHIFSMYTNLDKWRSSYFWIVYIWKSGHCAIR